MAMYAQQRALHLFEKLTGGRIATGIIDVYPGEQPPREVHLPWSRIAQVLGIEVPQNEVERILFSLGYEFGPGAEAGIFRAIPPHWRPDIEIADDVIEDIGRIYGYDRLPITFLRGVLPPVEPRPLETMRERLRDAAAGLGFDEVITYSLVDRVQLDAVTAPADTLRRNPLAVRNPVAAQHALLRTSLRGSLLETFAANRRHEEGALRLFEIAVEFLPAEADLPHERPVLCAVMGGAAADRWGRPLGARLDFFDAKGACEAMLAAIRVDATYSPLAAAGLLEGHAASVVAAGREVGVVGRVHPATAGQFRIDEPVYLIELWLEDLVPVLPARPPYSPPPRYPAVRQDIALVVRRELPAGRVLDVIRSHRSRGVAIVADLFDDYRGPGVADGKKSLAIRLQYQASDRTLTDAEVATVQQGLLTRLAKEFGAVLRG
jgi:phenylalanyl-tRNA synthetase beta chain